MQCPGQARWPLLAPSSLPRMALRRPLKGGFAARRADLLHAVPFRFTPRSATLRVPPRWPLPAQSGSLRGGLFATLRASQWRTVPRYAVLRGWPLRVRSRSLRGGATRCAVTLRAVPRGVLREGSSRSGGGSLRSALSSQRRAVSLRVVPPRGGVRGGAVPPLRSPRAAASRYARGASPVGSSAIGGGSLRDAERAQRRGGSRWGRYAASDGQLRARSGALCVGAGWGGVVRDAVRAAEG